MVKEIASLPNFMVCLWFSQSTRASNYAIAIWRAICSIQNQWIKSPICSITVAVSIWCELLYNKQGDNLLTLDSAKSNLFFTCWFVFVEGKPQQQLKPAIITDGCEESKFKPLVRGVEFQAAPSSPSVSDTRIWYVVCTHGKCSFLNPKAWPKNKTSESLEGFLFYQLTT